MSTTSKKPLIDEDSRIFVDELQTTDQLYREYDEYLRQERNTSDRKKRKIAEQMDLIADDMMNQIDEKNVIKEKKKNELIGLIIEKSDDDSLDIKQLYDMPYEDVNSIYVKVMESHKSFFQKLFDFFM